jgi:hypothetical protein
MTEARIDGLEGRLLAQRKLIALVVAVLDRDGRADEIWRFIEARGRFVDGEEDPGVLPSAAAGIEGALASELGLIAEAARRYAADAGTAADRPG